MRARGGQLFTPGHGVNLSSKTQHDPNRASGGRADDEGALRATALEAIEEAVARAIATAAEGQSGQGSGQGKGPLDAFVTVHAALSGGGGGKGQGQQGEGGGAAVALSAHACAMPLALLPPPPLTLEVRGEGRRDPEMKHSKWLWDRQELERFKIGAGGEVALSRPVAGGGKGEGEREVLEGLVTNLFVVRGGQLLTAGDGVLKGHVRGMVLEAGRALGMEVREDVPLLLREVPTWEEAFLTGGWVACVCVCIFMVVVDMVERTNENHSIHLKPCTLTPPLRPQGPAASWRPSRAWKGAASASPPWICRSRRPARPRRGSGSGCCTTLTVAGSPWRSCGGDFIGIGEVGLSVGLGLCMYVWVL